MSAFRKTLPVKPASAPVKRSAVNLEALSRETGVPVKRLRTFAAISDPANEQRFTAEYARKAFAGVKLRPDHAQEPLGWRFLPLLPRAASTFDWSVK